MNRPTIQELIELDFQNLDKTVQGVVNDEQTAIFIDIAAEKALLNEDESQNLFDEVVYVLFGYTPLKLFKEIIKVKLDIVDGLATIIYDDLNKNIFSKVVNGIKVKYSPNLTLSDFIPSKNDDALEDDEEQYNDAQSSEKGMETDDTSPNEALNPNDILKEIESPTPSVQVTTPTPAPAPSQTQTATDINTSSHELDIDALELTGKTVAFPAKTTSTPIKTEVTPGTSDVQLKGFTPVDNTVHPAQKTADKLENVLTQPTKTAVKEVYQVRGPDPYREPFV